MQFPQDVLAQVRFDNRLRLAVAIVMAAVALVWILFVGFNIMSSGLTMGLLLVAAFLWFVVAVILLVLAFWAFVECIAHYNR